MILRLLAAAALGAGATLAVVSQGTFVYSAFQHQIPFRTALKMAPDPANIWSWHGSISGQGPIRQPILVDLDGNGRNDTENPHLRVLVTDVQVEGGGRVYLTDGALRRWLVHPTTTADQNLSNTQFMTPLLLPIGSTLTIEVDWTGSVSVSVNLIGREVTL